MARSSLHHILSQQLDPPKQSTPTEIPPRLKQLIFISGIAGVFLVFMGSLSSGEDTLASTDKLIHFAGYFLLGSLFSIGLRPLYWAPAILLLIAGGVGLEFLQPIFGRKFEIEDMYVNTLGIFVGFFVGMVGRRIFKYVQDEILNIAAHKQTVFIEQGDIIFNQEEPSDYVYVVIRGQVEIIRTVEDKDTLLGIVNPGGVFGEMGVIRNDVRYAMARATENSSLFIMNKAQMLYNVEGMQHPCIPVVHALAKRLAETNMRLEELTQNMSSATADMLTEEIPIPQPQQTPQKIDEHLYREITDLVDIVLESIAQVLDLPKQKFGTVRNRQEFDAMAAREGIELKQGKLLMHTEELRTSTTPQRVLRNIALESIQTFSLILQYIGKQKEITPQQKEQLSVLENEIFIKNGTFRTNMIQLQHKLS